MGGYSNNDIEKLPSIKQTRKAAISGWIGSTLEYYDFFIYAMAASIVFPNLFFPSNNYTVAIIASLATYGVGYVARPIGAFVLGYWGDRHGRKSVLILCMFLMGFSTICVGLLPTYQQVGIWAPIFLVVLRLIQGFAVAGEMSGAGSLILEQAPLGRRGFYGSFVQQGISFGLLLAAAVFLPFAKFLPAESFMTWGWRIPFLLSIIVIIVGVLIRRHVSETRTFTQTVKRTKIPKAPIKQALQYHWRDMLKVTFMSLNNIVPVTITVFGAAYATQAAYGINIPKDSFLWVTLLANIVAIIVTPIMGMASDKFGRRPLAMIGVIGSGAMCYLFLNAISQHDLTSAIIYAIIGWGVIYQGFNAIFPCYYPELFPADVRVTAVAIANNIGVPASSLMAAVFAYIAPPGSQNIAITIGIFCFAITCISGFAVFVSRETFRLRGDDLGNIDAKPVSKQEYEMARIGFKKIENDETLLPLKNE